MLCIPRLQGHHHWSPASCMGPMMCLLMILALPKVSGLEDACAQCFLVILWHCHHLLGCLLLPLSHWITPSSCSEHIPKSQLLAMCIKLYFQQVFICSNWTPYEEVMLVLPRRYALSREISERAALKDFSITLHTVVQIWRFLMRWKEDLIELHNNLLFDHGISLILDENLSQQQCL